MEWMGSGWVRNVKIKKGHGDHPVLQKLLITFWVFFPIHSFFPKLSLYTLYNLVSYFFTLHYIIFILPCIYTLHDYC